MHLPLNASQPAPSLVDHRPAGHSRAPSLWQRAAAVRRTAAVAATVLGLLSAAVALPALAAPNRTYNKSGASFKYPAGWKITEDALDEGGSGIRSVDLEGPDDELVMLVFNPMMSAMNLEKLASSVTSKREDGARKTANAAPAEQVTMGPTTTTPITRRVGGKEFNGLLQTFQVTMDGETAAGESRVFSLDFGDAKSVVIITQARAANAKRMEATTGLVLDTLRYRPKR